VEAIQSGSLDRDLVGEGSCLFARFVLLPRPLSGTFHSEFERHMEEYRTGKMTPPMNAALAEEVSGYTGLRQTVRRAVFHVME